MEHDLETTIPVLPLATEDAKIPQLMEDGPITSERLSDLRGVLAAMADQPVATLEIRPRQAGVTRRDGIRLGAASPLAQQLTQLITNSTKKSTAVATATNSGENLYRLVVPAKVAREFGAGAVKPMLSTTVPGGIQGALVRSGKISAQASFIPVGTAAGTGIAGSTAAGTSIATGGAATVLTVAAPLVLMAVAVGVSANAEIQRERAIQRITDLVENLGVENLSQERSELKACTGTIDKATSILLDRGKIGESLGLGTAVHTINVALSKAEDRLRSWQEAMSRLPESGHVELSQLCAFDGIAEERGPFRAYLELAMLAITLKRRVVVLQAVEHAQGEEGNVFRRFARELKSDQEWIDSLEGEINQLLYRLSSLQLRRKSGLRSPLFTGGEVDRLMDQAERIRSLSEIAQPGDGTRDVSIDIARRSDGSVVVLPADLV